MAAIEFLDSSIQSDQEKMIMVSWSDCRLDHFYVVWCRLYGKEKIAECARSQGGWKTLSDRSKPKAELAKWQAPIMNDGNYDNDV